MRDARGTGRHSRARRRRPTLTAGGNRAGSRRAGFEVAGAGNGLRRTYTGTKLETADTAKGSRRSFAPVLDPTQDRQGARADDPVVAATTGGPDN